MDSWESYPLNPHCRSSSGERSLTRLNKVSKQHKSNIDSVAPAGKLVSGTKSITADQRKHKDITKKVNKGGWRMPRLQEATKDAISCEKLRGGANDH